MSDLKDSTVVDIPYADEDSKSEGNSSGYAVTPKPKHQSLSGRKRANLRLIIDDSDSSESEHEMEKRDVPGPLLTSSTMSSTSQVAEEPAVGLRRNSFSMPALNEIDLDALRALHMKAMEGDDKSSTETGSSKGSLNDIEVREIKNKFTLKRLNFKI